MPKAKGDYLRLLHWWTINLARCVTSKWSFPRLFCFFLLEIFRFLFRQLKMLDKLRKYCHKFGQSYMYVAVSPSCEQEDFNSRNLIDSPSDWINSWTSITFSLKLRFFSMFRFSWVSLKVFFSSCFEEVLRYVTCSEIFLVNLYHDFLLYFTLLFTLLVLPCFYEPLALG